VTCKHSRAAVLALVLFIAIAVSGPSPASAAPVPTPLPQIDLASAARLLILAAASPDGFASVITRRSRIKPTPKMAGFPEGYRFYRAFTKHPDIWFYLGDARSTNEFAEVPTGASTLAHEGYQSPANWAATVQELVSPNLGQSYTKRVLRNGVIFYSLGKPTIEFFFVEGLIPSESRTAKSYNMYMLVFRPGATVLELVDPCRWWLTTPPPNWSAQTQNGACMPRWTELRLYSSPT
jgi:hypothetical protein